MKKYLIFVLIVLVIGALVIGVLAEKPVPPCGQAGSSNIANLYLYEKDPSDWSIVEGGAWGKMTYNLSGSTFDFVFNGHRLVPDNDYTLIYWPDVWPKLICLGTGTTDEYGDVHIMCSTDTGDLEDAKIWLVPSIYVNCDSGLLLGGWNPKKYLFEYELINFDDTDV